MDYFFQAYSIPSHLRLPLHCHPSLCCSVEFSNQSKCCSAEAQTDGVQEDEKDRGGGQGERYLAHITKKLSHCEDRSITSPPYMNSLEKYQTQKHHWRVGEHPQHRIIDVSILM